MSLLPTIIYKKHHFSFFVVLTSYTNCSNCSWFIVLLKTLNTSYAEIRYTSRCTLFSMLKYIKPTIMLAKCLNVSIQNSCFSVTSYHSWVEGKWNNLQVYLPKITKRWQHSIQPKIDLSYNLYNYSTAVSTSRKCKWNRAISCRVSQSMHNFISYSLCLLGWGCWETQQWWEVLDQMGRMRRFVTTAFLPAPLSIGVSNIHWGPDVVPLHLKSLGKILSPWGKVLR